MMHSPREWFLLIGCVVLGLGEIGCLYADDASVPYSQLSNQEIGQYLGWTSSDDIPGHYCGGYFRDTPISYQNRMPPGTPLDKTPIDITADSGNFSLTGQSTLTGNVHIAQQEHQVVADHVILNRNEAGNIDHMALEGHVQLQEPGRLVIADHADIPLVDQKPERMRLQDVIYRTSLRTISAWGTADSLEQKNNHELSLHHATYTTCPPDDKACAWHITAYRLNMDSLSNRGTAYGSVLWIKQVPVFFLPYFSFPLTAQRDSGFLYPSFMQSTTNGFSVTTPYYLNLAPNHDITLSPTFYEERGMFLNTEMRYLTPKNSGLFTLGIAPDDRKFEQLQQDALIKYAQNANLGSLEDASSTRTGFHWQDSTQFNKDWSANVNYNWVSDDYYTEDFQQGLSTVADYQLLQKGQVKYYGDHWDFSGLLQNYQTLHPVDQDPIANQYARLPELTFYASYPDEVKHFDYTMFSQFDHFLMDKNPEDSTDPVEGDRISLRPGINIPIVKSYGYLTPEVYLDTTAYELTDQGESNPSNPSRVLPMFDVDTGLYFDKETQVFGRPYTQTLEPRLYYLYVPYENQDDLPDFDSVLYTLNYDQLFQNNRFTSVDRIGDANQLSGGLSSRFIDQNTGFERFSLSAGSIMYFEDRKVSLCTTDSCAEQDKEQFSPFVSQARYNLSDHWSAQMDSSYDMSQEVFENTTWTIGYKKDPRRVVNLGYTYVREGSNYSTDTEDNDLLNVSQIHASYAWPLSPQWNTLGSIDVNTSYGNGVSYLLGAEYSTCCWGVRFYVNQQITGVEDSQNIYETSYYIQFVLKGMGTLNGQESSNVIAQNIANYNDDFIPVF